MNTVDSLCVRLADRRQQALLLERLAERAETLARAQDEEYDRATLSARALESRKGGTVRTGLGLIVLGVSSVPVAAATSPVLLVVGVVCGAGVLWSLRAHGKLVEGQDALDRSKNEAMGRKSDWLGKSLQWLEERRQLGPLLSELEHELAETQALQKLVEGGPAGSGIEARGKTLIVGGVAIRPR